jgi:hypothetical protein
LVYELDSALKPLSRAYLDTGRPSARN